jgi:hypothetical protein
MRWIALQTEPEQAIGPSQRTKHPPILLILPVNPMPPATQSEATNLMPPEAGSTRRKHLAIANTQCDKEPQEVIDISAIRDIDLVQGGEYVLL